MTTIAYRDGVLAGDSLICSDGMRAGMMPKITRRRDGSLCGVCGCASHVRSVLAWFVAGEPADSRPKIENNDAMFIIVRPTGKVESHDERGFSDDVAPYHAIGSGRDIALGAMAAGSSALKAVKLAATIDTRTGGKVVALPLKRKVLTQRQADAVVRKVLRKRQFDKPA